MFTDILTHKHGRILVVSLNRPSNLNAWNDKMYKEWGLILKRAAVDDTIACVVLRGNGKAFSAGQDVAELADYPIGTTGAPSFDAMLRSHITFPKPLIAAVHGIAIGWGATLLAHCDLVIMSASSRIRVPFTALGLAPEGGSSITFPTIMKQEANWLLYTSSWYSANDCKRVGLAFSVVADMDLVSETRRIAETIAKQPIVSLMATKKLIVAGKTDSILAAHKREQAAFANGLLGGAANVEALKALREKREPNFSRL